MWIRWSGPALEDICAILEYSREQGEPDAFVGNLYKRIRKPAKRLLLFPRSGRLSGTGETREVRTGNLPYLLQYRVSDDMVEILRVLHTSRRRPSGQ